MSTWTSDDVIKAVESKEYESEKVDDRGRTLLHRAIELDLAEQVKTLSSMWKNLLTDYPDRKLARQFAAAFNKPAMIPILVDAGSDVNDLCDLASSTALMEAARRDNVECAKVLLARGADPLKRDKTGRVPLTHALMSNSAQVVELLTSLGDGVGLKAAANKADFDEFTSLHNAIVWNSNCVRAYLTILNGGPPASKAA